MEFGLTIEIVTGPNSYAFILTCQNGHMNVIEYLVYEFGLNIADVCANNSCIVFNACEKAHVDIVKYLCTEFVLTADDNNNKNNNNITYIFYTENEKKIICRKDFKNLIQLLFQLQKSGVCVW
jgi:hypothetical protein